MKLWILLCFSLKLILITLDSEYFWNCCYYFRSKLDADVKVAPSFLWSGFERIVAEERNYELKRVTNPWKRCRQTNGSLSKKELEMKALLKRVFQIWINAADALLEMIVLRLPSPVEAQKYRASYLYEGPVDDECGTAIRNCDQEEPLQCPCKNASWKF